MSDWRPQAGRLSPAQAKDFGRALVHGVGYVGVGPIFVLFNLPARWRKADPKPRPLPRLELADWVKDGSRRGPA